MIRDRYTCTATVPLRVFYGERLDPDARVGLSGLPGDARRNRIFGLVSPTRPGHLTYMAYGTDYFDPEEALAFCDGKEGEGQGRFYFRSVLPGDPGAVWASTYDLYEAFQALGMLP